MFTFKNYNPCCNSSCVAVLLDGLLLWALSATINIYRSPQQFRPNPFREAFCLLHDQAFDRGRGRKEGRRETTTHKRLYHVY